MGNASSQYTRQHRVRHENQLFFPINQLPEHILRQIFETTQNYWYHALSPAGIVQRRTVAAFGLSHVCQKWRRISQDNALLWTDIDTKDMDLANRCLALCKDAPIQLILQCHYCRECDVKLALELLQHHLYHVRNLSFRFGPEDILRVLRALPCSADWDHTAPSLSAIAIQPVKPPHWLPSAQLFQELGANMAMLPIFTHPPRQLLDISFDYVTPPTSSSIWDERRKLTFLRCSDPQRSVSDYLNLVARSPNLTCLTIYSGLSVTSTLSFAPHVTFHYLTELNISGWSPTDVVSFLNCLIIPKIKELTIRLDFFNGSSLDLLPSSQRSLNIFQEIRALKIEPRWIGCEHVGNLRVRPMWITWTGSCSNRPEIITIDILLDNENKIDTLTNILSLFSHLESLTLTNPFAMFTWDLGISHSVQTLRIEGLYDVDQTCLRILEELIMRKCLPCLTRIELVDITFL
ncbi:hypothetical protein K439DRAFT_313242 [Ramaria rubella]|nr:hypothetical protein K439DRAFT_313242 [Ramaria rubella]